MVSPCRSPGSAPGLLDFCKLRVSLLILKGTPQSVAGGELEGDYETYSGFLHFSYFWSNAVLQ